MSDLIPSHGNSVVIGALLRSSFSEYLVESVVGQGAFGTVAKCRRIADRKTVAIKMMKNQNQEAIAEVAVLLKLQFLDSDKCNLVRWYGSFLSNEHICLEFEHLDRSLSDLMVDRNGKPLHIKEIRPIVQQLANALDHLKVARIIHADLKLDNIMLVNHAQEPFRVKVIDFGLAGEVSAARQGSYLQIHPYRSPEIILGLPFTEAIDMWSLGIVIATLYLGYLPFPGSNEYDMMRYIVETQGQPPDTMLTLGWKTGRYFQHNLTNSTWKLKTPEQFWRESGIRPQETMDETLGSLYDLVLIRAIGSKTNANGAAELSDVLHFVDLLNGMLQLDAAKRITPRQVLNHQFTSMCNMVWMHHFNSDVRSCSELMNPTTDSRKAVCGCLQQTSSATAHPIQQNLLSASAERSQYSGNLMQASTVVITPLAQAYQSNPDTSSSYSLKRKMDDTGYRDQRKRVKTDPAPPTSSSSKALTDEPDRRSVPAESRAPSGSKTKSPDVIYMGHIYGHQRGDNRNKIRRSNAAPFHSISYCSSPSVKRKMADRDDSDERHERKRLKKTDQAPPTCCSQVHADDRLGPDRRSVPAESRAPSGSKTKSPDVIYMGHIYGHIYGHQRGDNRNKIRRSNAAPFHSISYCSSPSVKRKMADRDDSDDRHESPTIGPDRRSVPDERGRT
ncbi:hypothetical protein VZT92_022992 [Zoarces viviparus]|uniref:Protein kinase domain-containing protein n=1 Tax=Zoarces viviparus TaxID=48416 RepID=A0AAW1E4T7_ZOAVI